MKKDDGLTPAMRQYKEIKREHPDAFLFFRMGDFYELFYEDAVGAAKILDIALTSRGKEKSGNPIPLCGIPYHALDSYLAKMIRAGKKVAICEQVEDPKKAKGIVKRAVVRLVTPGTLIEDSLLDSSYSNYVASLFINNESAGLAFAELSTGEFLVTELEGRNVSAEAEEIINQFQPSEIVISDNDRWEEYAFDPGGSPVISRAEAWAFGYEYAAKEIKKQFSVSRLEGFGLEESPMAVSAAGALLHYLKETQKGELGHFRSLRKISRTNYLIIDSTTRRNLELFKSLYGDGTRGSLISVIDESVTGMGKRMLQEWLMRPLKEKVKIEKRLNAVEDLTEKLIPRSELRRALKKISDIERIVSRVSLHSGNPRDLVALSASLEQFPAIKEIIKEFDNEVFRAIFDGFDLIEDVKELIEKSIVDQPPVTLRDGGIIRDGFNGELDEYREIARDGKKYILGIESGERERTGINNLKVKYNKVFGYYIEVSKSHLDKVPDDYIRKQTLVNAERFITPELKEYEAKVLGAEDKINDLEFDLFNEIRQEVARQGFRIQEMSLRIATLDVIAALAELAVQNDYSKPEITETENLKIKDGRHPVIDKLHLEEKFIPNDTRFNSAEKLLVITGPNMGGKSTYLRQVALIVIMAQMGSFVPAAEAKIGLVDRVFTRVGASDSLVQGRSTFLVEMQETAEILNNATPKSLLILDEIGRGTSTFDGLSLAWAVVEYIATYEPVKARTLFATHYHELTELAILYPGIKNYSLSVKEWKDQVIFLRKVIEGGSDKSYGIQVAKLAGIPPAVIERSKEILNTLEEKELDEDGNPVLGKKDGLGLGKFEPTQQSLFAGYLEDSLITELKKLDINTITPIESLNLLEKIQKRLKGK